MPITSQIQIEATKLGQNNYAPSPPSPETLELINRLLQHNHDQLHIFFRDMNGHNHLVHNLLTRLVLGATTAQLQIAFDDDLPTQRPMPALDEAVVQKLANDPTFFANCISEITHYTNFLVFFERQIETQGWKQVVNEYVFSRSEIANAILPLMFDGAYHSIIHLGLGVEFEQPSIIAEALAQAAAHQSFDTKYYFLTAEARAKEEREKGKENNKVELGSEEPKLVDLIREIKEAPALLRAGRVKGLIGTMKLKRSILANAGDELIDIAARFRVTPETLERRVAEVLNLCAYMAGAAQRAGKQRKVDFFFMHCVTSSIFFSVLVRSDWISIEDKVRLVEFKGRLDLAWYVVCGLPELDIEAVQGYRGEPSGDMSWGELFAAINEQHDDGHVAKFARALKNGEEVCRPFEDRREFVIKGDMWLRIARMAYDTTLDTNILTDRWVVMAGMDEAWDIIPSL